MVFDNHQGEKEQRKYRDKKKIPNDGGEGMTQSPGERPFTPEPTECTSPTPSYPPTAGTCGLTGYTPIISLSSKIHII